MQLSSRRTVSHHCVLSYFPKQHTNKNWGLRPYGMLRSVRWQFATDVSGQLMGPISEGKAVQDVLVCGCSVDTNFSESVVASSWMLQGCWDSTSHFVVVRVMFFVLFLCIYVVFVYLCSFYNCNCAVEPERKIVMNDLLHYNYICYNYYNYNHCHPVYEQSLHWCSDVQENRKTWGEPSLATLNRD
jgi:hypothetical protein